MVLKRRFLSMFTAMLLVLMLFTLLPKGALTAQAISGSGTLMDPYIVTTYAELQAHTNGSQKEVFIKLGSDITVDDYYAERIYVSGFDAKIHLDLAGHTLKRTDDTQYNQMFMLSRGTLYIDDSVGGGAVRSSFKSGEEYTIQSQFYISGGSLVINGGSFYNFSYTSVYDEIFYIRSGELTINNGDFYGGYRTFAQDGGSTVINGGRFYNSKHLSKSYKPTVSHQFHFRSKNGGSVLINGCELISEKDSTSSPAGITLYSYGLSDDIDTFAIGKYTSSNTVVMIDGTKIDTSADNKMYGKRILFYTQKTMSGVRWDGYKLNWSAYPGASYYDLQLEKANGSGGYTIAKQGLYTDATSMDLGNLIKAAGSGTYRVLMAAFTSKDERISKVTASDDTEYDPRTVIEKVELRAVTPKDGNVSSEPTVLTDGIKTMTGGWYKGTRIAEDTKMSADEKFAAGQQYTLYCFLYPDNGYKLADGGVSAAVNGESAQTILYNAGEYVAVKYTFTALARNILPYFMFDIIPPEAGTVIDDTVTFTYPSDQGITVKNSSNVSGKVTVSGKQGFSTIIVTPGTSKYIAGVTYTVDFKLSQSLRFGEDTSSKQELTDDTVVYINNTQARFVKKSGIYRYYKAEFTIPEPDVLLGDVNNDGKVNMKDLTTLQRWINGWPVTINEANSDIDGSGNIGMKDITALQRLINS